MQFSYFLEQIFGFTLDLDSKSNQLHEPKVNLHALEIYLVFMCKSVVKQKVKCTYHADCRAPISNDLWTLTIQIQLAVFY